jgi:hypothetical protein
MATSQEVSNLAIYKVRGDENAQNEWTQWMRISCGLIPEVYDEIVLSYTGSNLTGVVYKLLTVTVGTLTLSYTGAQLDKVVRT